MNSSLPPPSITRRSASAEDVPFLLALRHVTMDPHLAVAGIAVDDAEHLARVMYRLDSSELLLVDDEVVGLLKLTRDGQAWEVIQVQLLPKLQGQGLGAAILRAVIAEAEAAGASLSLSVLKQNPARSLYERLGFVVEGEDPHEFLMRRLAGTTPVDES